MKKIKIKKNERILAVVPEYVAGPGWANAVVWVYVASGNEFRTECIQIEDRSPDMHALFRIGATVQAVLVSAVPIAEE